MGDNPRVLYRVFDSGDDLAEYMEESITRYIVTNCYIVPRGTLFHIWLVVRDLPLN